MPTGPHSDVLSKPISLPCGGELPNRIAKSAMSEQLSDEYNSPTEDHARLYRRWAEGGTGLSLTGNVMVDRRSREGLRNVVVEDDRDLASLRRWASEGQVGGCRLWMQVSHPGRQTVPGVSQEIVAPSPVRLKKMGPLFSAPRQLRPDEIESLIDRFATTAAIARMAGFSGVQVHGAHGYLCAQFLSPITNRRTDRWGGTLDNRMRFLLEVVRTVRGSVGADFPVSVKLNSNDFQRGGSTVRDAVVVAQALEAERLDLLELSGGTYESPSMMVGPGRATELRRREAYFLEAAAEVRAATSLPLMLTGGLRSAAAMASIVADGTVDVVGLARPLAVDPDLPKRILSGESDGVRLPRVTLHNKTLDSMLNLFWYVEQIHRMADGEDPDPELSLVGALLRGLAGPLRARFGRVG
jgi:2,4-dienoyl-CoA reductase-like NADH-dependent reductase (Old Yellow Enzyme family)